VAAGKGAGLTVQASRMRLRREWRDRLIQVDMVTPTGPLQRCVISVTTTIGIDRGWSGRAKIGCASVDDHASVSDWKVPILRGREDVLLKELPQELPNAVKECEQVAAARKAGIDGPYAFNHACWETL